MLPQPSGVVSNRGKLDFKTMGIASKPAVPMLVQSRISTFYTLMLRIESSCDKMQLESSWRSHNLIHTDLLFEANKDIETRKVSIRNKAIVYESSSVEFDSRTLKSVLRFINSFSGRYPLGMPVFFTLKIRCVFLIS